MKARPAARAAIAIIVLSMLPWAAVAGPAQTPAPAVPDLATARTSRWIVQLREPSMAAYRGGYTGLAATSPVATGARRLDVNAAASRTYAAFLGGRQNDVAARLRALVPGATIQRAYRVVLNALAVKMNASGAAAVRRLPGVKAVTPDMPFTPTMYATAAQLGVPSVWQRLGGIARAGQGVKVAIIDSGIYVTKDARSRYAGNACFADKGYRAPAGYPKGETRYTNNKVIVARSYFRPDDPPAAGDGQAIPGDSGHSHGSHVGGTVACNAGTRVNYLGVPLTIGGLAPRAYLMNYRVFYTSRSAEDFQNGNAYVVELAAAMEDAVSDGADVVSNSWGSSYQNTLAWPDPMVQAAEAATDAGAVMVFAQGNSGPTEASGNSPANSPKVIAVGATTKSAAVAAGDVSVPGGPAALTGMPVGPARFGPSADAVGPAGYVAAESVALDQSRLGCSLENDTSPFPPASMTGQIALIERGTCAFSEKVYNAQRAGAIAAIVYNNTSGGDAMGTLSAGAHAADVTIPAWFMRRSNGIAMREHRAANAGAQASFARRARAVANTGDVLAGFSSRGPSGDQLLKPDVVAPGVDVLSAGYGGGGAEYLGFGAVSGTSMATPHVAGAAALLVQAHPDWTPAQIKSALMSTATETVFKDTTRRERLGVLDRGAGRIAPARAMNPGLTFDRPSISAGNVAAGRTMTFAVTATNVGTAGAWRIRPAASSRGLAIRSDVAAIALQPRRSGTFTVTLSTPASADPGVYQGSIALLGPTFLHIPVYLRVVPIAPQHDVLLVDDDGSSADPALLDVSGRYTAALQEAGLSFEVNEPWVDGFPALTDLFRFRMVLIFTGNNASFATSGFSGADQDTLMQWMDSGGRLLVTGQNIAEATDGDSWESARIGRGRLYHGYLGVLHEDDDVFGMRPPSPTAQGEGLMAGMTVDLSPGTGGLPNQTSVEAMAPMFDNDSYQAPETVRPLFAPTGGDAPAGARLAWVRGSEPSLEQSRRTFAYRSAAFGFGLEGVSGASGTATGAAILARTAKWLLGEVRASIRTEGASAFRAAATSTAGVPITRLRWDFGDGSRIVTGGARMTHRYARGAYTLRVEATDAFGHRTIASRRVVVR